MLGPVTHDPLLFYQGDSILIDMACTDVDGNVLSLEGANIEWMLDDANGDNVLHYWLGDGIELAQGPVEGVIEITVPANVTEDFPVGWYRDQLRVITSQGLVVTQLVGLIEIKSVLGRKQVFEIETVAASSPEFGAPLLEINPSI